MKKVSIAVVDGKIVAGMDTDQDGKPSIKLNLHMSEAVQEAFDRGVEIEGARVASLKFEGTTLKLVLDTDKDGEALLEIEADLMESLDESGVLKQD